jgi:hypothetical protein
MDYLLNYFYNCKIEQRTAGNIAWPNTKPEVPSDEILEITERLFSGAIDQPCVDEKFLMAKVDSLCSLLEKAQRH